MTNNNSIPVRSTAIVGWGDTSETQSDLNIPSRPVTPVGQMDWWNRLNSLQNKVGGVTGKGGIGTVTTVALAAPPDIFTVTGSPVTSGGTLTLNENDQSANTIWAGPATGAADVPGFRAMVQADLPTQYGTAGCTSDGGILAPTAGTKGYLVVPYNAIITGWFIMANTTGSCVWDVKKASSISGIGSTTSIVASAPPTLSGTQAASSTTLTGWTTTITAGTLLEFDITSASGVTRVTLELQLKRT